MSQQPTTKDETMKFEFEIVTSHDGIFAVGEIAELEIVVTTPTYNSELEAAHQVTQLLLEAQHDYLANLVG